jgi:hypothetical protein
VGNMSSNTRATDTSRDGDLSGKQKPAAALGTALVLRSSVLEAYDAAKDSRSGGASAAQTTAIAPLSGSLAQAALPPDRVGLVPRIRALAVRESSAQGGLVPRGEPDVIDAEFTVKTAAGWTGSKRPETNGFQGHPERPQVNARDFKSPQGPTDNKNALQSTATDERSEASGGGNWLWGLSDLFKTASGRDPLQRRQKDDNAKKVEGADQSGTEKTAEAPTAKKAAGGEEKIGSQGPKRLASKRTTVSSDLVELGSQQDAES